MEESYREKYQRWIRTALTGGEINVCIGAPEFATWLDNQDEATFQERRREIREAIARDFGVPGSVVGCSPVAKALAEVEECCQKCAFFLSDKRPHKVEPRDDRGPCKRRAPVRDKDFDTVIETVGWPQLMGDNWCGEFKANHTFTTYFSDGPGAGTPTFDFRGCYSDAAYSKTARLSYLSGAVKGLQGWTIGIEPRIDKIEEELASETTQRCNAQNRLLWNHNALRDRVGALEAKSEIVAEPQPEMKSAHLGPHIVGSDVDPALCDHVTHIWWGKSEWPKNSRASQPVPFVGQTVGVEETVTHCHALELCRECNERLIEEPDHDN